MRCWYLKLHSELFLLHLQVLHQMSCLYFTSLLKSQEAAFYAVLFIRTMFHFKTLRKHVWNIERTISAALNQNSTETGRTGVCG